MGHKIKLTMKQIEKFYNLPIEEAATRLGVSRPTISRTLRRHGVQRWPFRKVQAALKRRQRQENELSQDCVPGKRSHSTPYAVCSTKKKRKAKISGSRKPNLHSSQDIVESGSSIEKDDCSQVDENVFGECAESVPYSVLRRLEASGRSSHPHTPRSPYSPRKPSASSIPGPTSHTRKPPSANASPYLRAAYSPFPVLSPFGMPTSPFPYHQYPYYNHPPRSNQKSNSPPRNSSQYSVHSSERMPPTDEDKYILDRNGHQVGQRVRSIPDIAEERGAVGTRTIPRRSQRVLDYGVPSGDHPAHGYWRPITTSRQRSPDHEDARYLINATDRPPLLSGSRPSSTNVFPDEYLYEPSATHPGSARVGVKTEVNLSHDRNVPERDGLIGQVSDHDEILHEDEGALEYQTVCNCQDKYAKIRGIRSCESAPAISDSKLLW